MMRKIWQTVSMMVVALLLAVSVWASPVCSIDDSGMYFTGKTRSEWGKLLFQHKCFIGGHIYWLTQDQMD